MIFLLLSFFDLTPYPKHRFKFHVSSIVFQFSFLSSLGFALFVPPFTSHLSPVTNCPPETGGTRSEATEGVDKITHHSLLYNYLSTPSPLRGTHPCPRGRKWMLGHCRNTVITISHRASRLSP